MHWGLLGLAVPRLVHCFDGPIGTGSGELAMDRLRQALDTDKISNGAIRFDHAFRGD